MNCENQKSKPGVEHNSITSTFLSIPNDGTTTASDVYGCLFENRFEGTPEDYHKDVFVSEETFSQGVQALREKYCNGKTKLTKKQLQKLSIPFYARGNGIRVGSVMECCLAIETPFWKSEKTRLYQEKETREMQDCKFLAQIYFGDVVGLGKLVLMNAWQDPEGRILVIHLIFDTKFCKPLCFEKDKVCRAVKLIESLKKSKIAACDNCFNHGDVFKYEKETENDKVVWRMRYERIVKELLVSVNDVPMVKKSEEEKENGLKEVQKPLNLKPPPEVSDPKKYLRRAT